MIDGENCLKLYVNRIDYGIAAIDIPTDCYGIVDLYGQCEQVHTNYCNKFDFLQKKSWLLIIVFMYLGFNCKSFY